MDTLCLTVMDVPLLDKRKLNTSAQGYAGKQVSGFFLKDKYITNNFHSSNTPTMTSFKATTSCPAGSWGEMHTVALSQYSRASDATSLHWGWYSAV